MEKANRTCAIIPVYNEELTISEVLREIVKYVDKVIIVDDGSTDSSVSLAKKFEEVLVIQHKKNEGKGKALNTGFNYILHKNYDYCITLDADNQHPPEYISDFLVKINNYDIIIGNRMSERSTMPLHRRISNILTSKLLSFKTGQKLLDTQCGYRLYRTLILTDILPKTDGFEAESEILVNAARKRLKIGFTTIPTIYNTNTSKMRSFQAIIGFLKILLFH